MMAMIFMDPPVTLSCQSCSLQRSFQPAKAALIHTRRGAIIDITHPWLDKLPIYAAIGVPEVWRYAEQTVRIYRWHAAGYTVADHSAVFPGVTSRWLTHFAAMRCDTPRPVWLRSVRAWAETLPR
jgi:hypothetical protein